MFGQMDLLWARVYSERATVSTNFPGIYGMTTDRLGNVYFTRNDRMSPLNGYRMITVSKMDADGFVRWTTQVTADSIYYHPNLYYEDLAVDSLGNVYVVENGTQFFGYSFSRISKISPHGQKLWTKNVYTYSVNHSYAIERLAVDANNDIFLLYSTQGFVNAFDVLFHVAKMDSSGTIISDTTINQTGQIQYPYQLLKHSQGGYLVVCRIYRNNTYETLLTRILPDGSVGWTVTHNTMYANAILDAHNNIYAMYQTSHSSSVRMTKMDPFGNTIWDILSPNQYNLFILADEAENSYIFWDNGDVELSKLDTAGNIIWRKAYTPPFQANEKMMNAVYQNGTINIMGGQTGVPDSLGGPSRAFSIRMDTSGQVLGSYFHPMTLDPINQYEGAHIKVGQDGSIVSTIGSYDQTSYIFKTCGYECGYNINGKVTFDADGDCNVTPQQPGFVNAVIGIDGGQAYVLTDSNGNFRLRRDSGAIDIAPILPISYLNSCQPASYQLNITPQNFFYDHVDFTVVGNPFINASVAIESTPPRVARIQDIDVQINNLGTLSTAPYLELVLDPRVTIIPDGGSRDSIVGNHLYRQLPTIPPFSTITAHFTALVDTFISVGEVCTHYAYLLQVNADVDPTNNQDSTKWNFLTSYDPNDKAVFPTGVGVDGEFDFDSLQGLTYRIRFQNTGNDVAYNIAVRDTLSPLLDLGTFEMGAASHPFRLELDEHRALTWFFDNIYLPDSTTDLAGSNGFIKFRIKPLPGLPLGTRLENKAAIYFDYNLPVITNTAVLTNALPLVEADGPALRSALEVFPNPTRGRVTLRLRDARQPMLHVQVCDLRGAVLMETPVRLQDDEASIDISALPPGVYLVQASQGATRHVQRLLVW